MFGRGGHRDAAPPDPAPAPRTGAEDLAGLLAAIEALTVHLYAAHGLPHVPGHYRRADDEGEWELVSQTLTPAEKFDLVLQKPGQARWRYAAFDSLGARHEVPEVRKASALMAACRGIRHRIETGAPLTAQTLADAMRMGASYQNLVRSLPDGDTLPDLQRIGLRSPDPAAYSQSPER
ncbi:hypothetical protein [Brevundimonas vesicularis]|uniref:hypothetical protein n=1 Tax=Brevundimonas vesicularis TaxID=41276 RepID=UPI0038D4F24B